MLQASFDVTNFDHSSIGQLVKFFFSDWSTKYFEVFVALSRSHFEYSEIIVYYIRNISTL